MFSVVSTRISCGAWPSSLSERHTTKMAMELTCLKFISYLFSRIHGVKVRPTNIPSESRKRLTICPQGSFLFLISIRYPIDSSSDVALSTLSTSNSSQAWGADKLSGQVALPKQDSAAWESGQRANSFAP